MGSRCHPRRCAAWPARRRSCRSCSTAPAKLLNCGREPRVANRAQRRALRAMYRTCGYPGCDVVFDRCDIHHVIEWLRHGSTDLDNLLPLCSRHHHLVHEGRWRITLDKHRVITIHRPDGTRHFHGTTTNRTSRAGRAAGSGDSCVTAGLDVRSGRASARHQPSRTDRSSWSRRSGSASDVDRDDPSFGDGEGHDRDGRSIDRRDDSGGSVHERRVQGRRRAGEHERADRPPPPHRERPPSAIRPGVGAEHDVGIEQPDEPHRSRPSGPPRRRRRPPRARGPDRRRALTPPCTRRRARLASWRVASGERSTMGAISSNGTANMSCNTNASRSAGARVSSTTSSARPTESASTASCSGSLQSGRSTIGSGTYASSDSSRRGPARPQHVEAHPRRDRGQPSAEILDIAGVGAAERVATSLGPRRRPRSASRASGRRRPGDGCGAPRTVRPASHLRSSVTFLRPVVSYH